MLDAVVVGLADERFGEQVVAVCQTRSGAPLELEQLRDFCRGKLASYKIPRARGLPRADQALPGGQGGLPVGQRGRAQRGLRRRPAALQ